VSELTVKFNYNNLNILLVDDDKHMRRTVKYMLEELGCHSVLEAEDGEDGINTANESEHPIDLFVVDLVMPRLDGLGFVEWLRKGEGHPYATTPVIIITGNAEQNNIIKIAKLGINGILAKPMSIIGIEKQLLRAMTAAEIDPSIFH